MSIKNTSETVYINPASAQVSTPANEAGTVYVPGTTAGAVPAGAPELLTAGTNVGGYMIMNPISTKGSESVVYKAMKGGSDYALKLYKREVELSEPKMQALMQLQCPYIARLCAYGTHEGQPYEVYRYYKNGTLEGRGRIDPKLLKQYVNQLNEALHCLHNAQGVDGMVHGDLKPSNIFVSDDEESLLLGDFGVSNIATASGGQFAQICGTPEFAPPSTGLMDRMKKGPAFDYGALGLVVYYMATGYSYFAGFTAAEIAEGWEQGIRIPEELDTRIKMLLKGLLKAEESMRFGYEQVYDWYKGSFVQATAPKKLYAQQKTDANASLWFGYFDGQVVDVTSVEELVRQMRLHWDQAVIKLRDTNFYSFLDSFYPDGSVSAKIRGFLEDGDEDAAVFKTIYTLSDNAHIVYKGKEYGTASKLVEAMVQNDPDAREMIGKGLFLFYVDAMGYPAETYRAMQEVLSLKHCPESFKLIAIGYMFADKKIFNGWQSIDQLRSAVCNMSLEEIDRLVSKVGFLAWLYVMGLQELALSMVRMREDA
ncbi:MAG: protein kinase [Oscillospiraceae bacterium]|nr:protein kinase [Oscillospiraceae bacterium]